MSKELNPVRSVRGLSRIRKHPNRMRYTRARGNRLFYKSFVNTALMPHPSSVSDQAGGSGRIDWTDVEPDTASTSYQVWRSTDQLTWESIATRPSGVEFFLDAVGAGDYFYRVNALKNDPDRSRFTQTMALTVT